jgi:hypothetical protein
MLAFSLLGGPPTTRLLGQTPVAFQSLLGGLGADVDQNSGDGSSCPTEEPVWNDFYGSCVVACPAGQTYDSNGNCVGGSSSTPSNGGGDGGGHWYDGFVTAFTKGVTQGALAPKPGAPAYHPPVSPPWYTQWWGIGAIAVGVLGAGALLLGPKKSTAGVSGYRRR